MTTEDLLFHVVMIETENMTDAPFCATNFSRPMVKVDHLDGHPDFLVFFLREK
jgi:hypothetical protein